MSTSELLLACLRAISILAAATTVFLLVHAVGLTTPVLAPSFGSRGRNRSALRRTTPAFALFEPLLTQLAGVVYLLPLTSLRIRAERLIRRAGDAGGLCADELIVLSVLGLFGGALVGLLLVRGLDLPAFWAPLACVVMASWPAIRLDAVARERAKALERSLPSAMDLCVLCMGAGTDFPTALLFATRELGLGHEVCREELSVLLEQLSLGRTRVEALNDLSFRSGSHTVQQFVAAVCQSETKGTPLASALTIQSATLRQRRSVLAEEMAAKAGVRMMLPLMLMVCSVLLIIFGPFIVNGIGL